MRRVKPENERILTVVKCVVWTFWGFVSILVLLSAASEGPVRIPRSAKLAQAVIFPEGWGFFTRSPREPSSIVYRIEAGRLTKLTFSNTSAHNLFGVSRSARAFDAELALVLAPVLAGTWKDCRGDPTDQHSWAPLRVLHLANWSRTRYICGEILVVQQAPVPWAWSSSRHRIRMPSKILRATVDCSYTANPKAT